MAKRRWFYDQAASRSREEILDWDLNLSEKYSPFYLEYKAKKIRERYKNYLEIEVNRKKWTVQEDL